MTRFLTIIVALAFAGNSWSQTIGSVSNTAEGGGGKPPIVEITKPTTAQEKNVINWAFNVTTNGAMINSAKLDIMPKGGAVEFGNTGRITSGRGYSATWSPPTVNDGEIDLSGKTPKLPPGTYLMRVTVTYNGSKTTSDTKQVLVEGNSLASFGSLSADGKLIKNVLTGNYTLTVSGAYTAPANSGYTTKNVQVTVLSSTPPVKSGGDGPTYSKDFSVPPPSNVNPTFYHFYAQVDVYDTTGNLVATVYSVYENIRTNPPKN